jgi:hypothetical protein
MVTEFWSHLVDRCAVIDKEDDCADVFTTSSNGT